jgi:ketopantoate hydroxymethyltransferase
VFVTHDGIGLTPRRPRFAPFLGDLSGPLKEVFGRYVRQVTSGEYPAPEHQYEMSAEEKSKFIRRP